MLVLFSSMPKKEGTVQFLLSFADALRDVGEEVRVFLPKGVCDSLPDAEHYDLVCLRDTIPFLSAKVKGIAARVGALRPEKVVFTDEGRGSLAVLEALDKQRVETALVVHDPTPHPTRASGGLKERFSRSVYRTQWERAFGLASKYILLSKTSAAKFGKVHPGLVQRASVMPLCPHPPVGVIGNRPAELGGGVCADGFYLFFGRIDEYKGLCRLLRAYSVCMKRRSLVIAGSGALSLEERTLADETPGVVILNRFILDAEMIWLFERCLCVCLPYIEASQSGVLAMAYRYEKPVIVSDLDGLTEFVSDGCSGLVFRTEEELAAELDEIAEPGVVEGLGAGASRYLSEHLDWGKNVRRWLEDE